MYPQVHVHTALCCQYIPAAIYDTRYSPAKSNYFLFCEPVYHRKTAYTIRNLHKTRNVPTYHSEKEQ